MISIYLILVLAFVAYSSVNYVVALRRNIANARTSGIHYIVVPFFFLNRWWILGHRLVLPLLDKLPPKYTQWVDFVLLQFTFDYGYEVFKRVGHDTFLTVGSGGSTLYTCEPAVISQITTRRNDFPKPIHIYQSLDIYGKNVVSTEGHIWRQHRKATSPPFTEKNNVLVWKESIRQAQAMLASWVGSDGKGHKTVDRLMDDTMRLSLNVISAAGFGRKMDWPTTETTDRKDESGYVDLSKIKNEDHDIDEGHTMSYTYAIHCLLDNLLFQFLVPRWLLKKIPNTTTRKAQESYIEWGNYMKELLYKKKADIESGTADKDTNDILTQLVKGQLIASDKKSKDEQLTEAEVMGNMFVLILAGHETAANSVHFSVLYCALHPASQRRLQQDLDRDLQGRPPSQWDYERDLPSLFGDMAGAILAEELRLVPPVVGIPKSTNGAGPQKLTVKGKSCIVPGDTYISLATASAHRHPDYWPKGPSTLPGGRTAHPISNVDNDLEEFRPERWLLSTDANGTIKDADGIPVETLAGGAEKDLGVNESADTSDRLFKPPKGAYVPFSDGYRACLGRRFAQVEVLAVLAVLFQNYSVELAVDKYATDEELDKMSTEEKAEVWQKAAEDARELLLNGMSVQITLQIRKGTVPFRFVKRGEEKFPVDVDAIWKKNHPEKVKEGGTPGWSCWRRNPSL